VKGNPALLTDGDRRVVVYCASLFEFRIFAGLRRQLADRGWPMVLVGHRLSIWLFARAAGVRCILLRPGAFDASVEAALDRACGAGGATLMQWGGQRAYGRVATAYARRRGLRTVYLELGNIVPKLFADPEGVNGAARLARSPQHLDRPDISDAEIDLWTRQLIEQRRAAHPPQPNLAQRINPWFLADYLGALVMRTPQPEPVSILAKARSKLGVWLGRHKPPEAAPDRPYVFYPGPPREEDLKAFAFAADYARDQGLLLVVKPHPMESDALLLKHIATVCSREGHLITSANTTRLVEGAAAVITISSNVGLEALLLNKPLIVLGDSLFRDFTPRRTVVFAMKYLIDYDPFGATEISDQAAERLIDLIEGRA